MRWLYLLLSLVLLLFVQHTVAQGDTIRPGKAGLVARYLKPGLRQYLLLYQNPKTSRQLSFWYWLRDIALEKREGKDVVVITQRWYGSDTSAYRTVWSVNAAGDFAPIYHQEEVKGKLSAYNWGPDGVKGADTVEGNAHRGFELGFAQPNYNWNLDIETFEMLPLAAGKSFLINFYDAGFDTPHYVRYAVTGSQKIGLLDGQQTDCWILHSEDTVKGTTYTETYWISKQEHQFLKEEDHFNGMIRYKLRMPDAMPDMLPDFTH